ncbi:unnamed protein product [Brachionus calyciflorus]|uniref:Uncharacterized protein n=1 Tax=Brachionus calyciflorus TaxID=104777 RepID=A0A813R9X3_9BILA|nr:unnamed protein product [Brachionus calyciflorus]
MSQIQRTSIAIKMGSKQFKINYEFTYNNFNLNTLQLVEIVLKKLQPKNENLSELAKTYAIYESAYGVERLINKDENILNLIKNQESLNSNVCFIIRKKSLTSNQKYNANVKKCFRQLHSENELRVYEDDEKTQMNLYEYDLKKAYLKQILANEITLNKQIENLETFDKILNKDIQSDVSNSKGIFKSIYKKIKNYKAKSQKRSNLNQSSIYLLDSAGESSSSNSSPSTSSSKLDTLF